MSRRNWFGSLFARPHRSAQCDRQSSHERQSRLAFEPLELRTLLTTLTVDIADVACGDAGDNLYCGIQEAVDAASSGDKIKVHAGTYHPFVVNTDNLTIGEANANSNPVVDGDLKPGDENGVEINANGVTIKGLTARNASGSIGLFSIGHGFFVTGANNMLKGNTASDNGSAGFKLSDSDGNTLKGNTASGNGTNGFDLRDSDGNTLMDNTASDNTFNGFQLTISDSNTLRRNMASGNAINGFRIQIGSDGNTLKGNTASDNGSFGFRLTEESDGNTLKGNTASGNSGDGFQLDDSHNNTLTGNRAIHNEGSGFVLVNGSDNNVLKRNRAIDNDEWGFLVDAVLANMFQGNACDGNGLGGSNQPGIC